MSRLFGTDGVRGIANKEITAELAMSIGRAAAYVLAEKRTEKPKVLIGKDPRISSDMIEAALVSGLCSVGADVILAGCVPTPAVAYLVGEIEADAGIMISASHNPCEYNGIKIFDGAGYKLPDEVEDRIEEIVNRKTSGGIFPVGKSIGRTYDRRDLKEKYINHIIESVGCDLDGLDIVLDCANGSASETAEELFTRLGAKVHLISASPDGLNINEHCGSTYMENLVDHVRKQGADLGLSFDGDADRCLAVDENGRIIDGDKMLAIFSRSLKEQRKLKSNTTVITVMSNLGLKLFCEKEGIHIFETRVGDRYVLEKMLEGGYTLGGEQSGHIIFGNHATTGDGQLSGAMLAAVLVRNKITASKAASIMESLPQFMLNITATDLMKQRLITDEKIMKEIDAVSEILGKKGRILVRPSGTEPLIRIMLEGEDTAQIKSLAKRVAGVIEDQTNEDS